MRPLLKINGLTSFNRIKFKSVTSEAEFNNCYLLQVNSRLPIFQRGFQLQQEYSISV